MWKVVCSSIPIECFFLSCCTIVIYSISSCSEERFQWDLTAIILDCELLHTYYSLEILAHTKWNEICGSLKSIHNKDSILDKETMISKVNMSHRNFEYKIRKVCMLSYSNGIKTTATHLCLHCQLLLTAVCKFQCAYNVITAGLAMTPV